MIDLDAFMILTKYYTMCIIGKQITRCDIKNCKPCINLIHCGIVAVSYTFKPSVIECSLLKTKKYKTKPDSVITMQTQMHTQSKNKIVNLS